VESIIRTSRMMLTTTHDEHLYTLVQAEQK